MVLAPIWLLWHVPLFGSEFTRDQVPPFAITLFGGALVLTWLYNRSAGSVLLPILMHATVIEHTSPFDALVQAIEGDAEVTVAGKPIGLKTGDVLLLPAEKPHAVKATTRFKMVLTMIRS